MSGHKLFNTLIGSSLRFALLFLTLTFFMFCILAGMDAIEGFHEIFVSGIIVFFFMTASRHLWLIWHGWRAKVEHMKQVGKELIMTNYPSITIIMPAYNEEAVIKPALTSLTKLNYPNYDIVVVNDGSTDKTSQMVKEVIATNPAVKITLIEQSNGGKAAALNNGIIHAEGELFFCVDSDSRIHRNALLYGASHFTDPELAAVAGAVEISKVDNLLLKFQQLEYQFCLNFTRQAFSRKKIVTIIPGPSGMFRRQAMIEAGGYEIGREVFAEDAELTVRLLTKGWKVVGDERMVATTEAPREIFPLLRQRYRWKRGLFQAFAKNILELINSRQKNFLFLFFNLLFDSFLFDVINFGIMLGFIVHFVSFGTISMMYVWFFALLFLDILVAIMFARPKQKRESVSLMLLQKVSYYLLLQAWGILALFDELIATEMSWDKLERTGELGVE
ncbi:MAG: glycosyltransferase family 2 protein [Deltaproteobacteria bacterium]|nr:MAG: glycosyltransferase family 2 protein [Deltaproteobacteria bacterium]